MNEILVIKNLTKKYSKFIALNSLNLSIPEKSCVGFLGPNGAGKSTTIKILTGLLRPSSGNAYIAGIDVTAETRLALSNVGVVEETSQFIPKLSAHETLSYFGRLRGMNKNELTSKIKDVLELVHLFESRDKKVGIFSKGMNQRLALASALLHDPSLIILDEPSLGLDPRGMIEIREIISKLKQQGKTIFMSSHILSEVEEVCDKVAILDKGKLLRFQDVSELAVIRKSSSIQIETINSISDDHFESIKKLQGIDEIKKDSPNSFTVKFFGNNEDRANLLDSIKQLGIKVSTFRPIKSDLESLYMDNTSENE